MNGTDSQAQRQQVFRPVWFIVQQQMLLSIPFVGLVIFPFALPWLWVSLLVATLALTAWVALAVRCAQTHLRVGPEGLDFADVWHRGYLAWQDVREIDVVTAHPFPPVQIKTFTTLRATSVQGAEQTLVGSCLLSEKKRDALADALGEVAPHGSRLETHVRRELTRALQAAPAR